MRPFTALPCLIFYAALLSACSSPDGSPSDNPDGTPDAQLDCSIPASNQRIYQILQDVYLWHAHIPSADPTSFESPQALIESVRYNEIDKWSYIDTIEQNNTYYNEGQRVGIGVRMRTDTDGSLRIALVYPASPASDEGLARGDRILSINGKTIADIDQNNEWATILGPDEEGIPVDLAIQPQNGPERQISLKKRVYNLITTHTYRVFPFAGHTVGYLLFDRFIGTSTAELDKVFGEFKNEGVNELVLDLRYNGGGYIDVAHHLANLIGGKAAAGKIFAQIISNDRHSNWNKTKTFQIVNGSLDLTRVFIIATPATASSSELLINGLVPHLNVILTGGTTYGKPVGSGVWTDCDYAIHPISFRMLNAENHGDYFNGISPTCSARDDMDLPLGDENESALSGTLYALNNGFCSITALPPESFPPQKAAPRIQMPDEISVFSF